MPNRSQEIKEVEEEINQLQEEIEELEDDPLIKPHWTQWRAAENALAEAYLKYRRRLDHPEATPDDQARAGAMLSGILEKFSSLKEEEAEADMEGSELGEEAAEALAALHGKTEEVMLEKHKLMTLEGPEVASEKLVNSISLFGQALGREPVFASLMQFLYKAAYLIRGTSQIQQQQILTARLAFELLSKTVKGHHVSELLQNIYGYITYLEQQRHALPERARTFLRHDVSYTSAPAGSIPPPRIASTPPSSSSRRSSSNRRNFKKKDRLAALQHGMNEMGLSRRKQEIYGRREAGW
ncbi:hypothetical protein JCM8547_001108 [Rhodosporidiobolus lusitaniae]